MTDWGALTLKRGVPYRLAEPVSLEERRALGTDSDDTSHQFIMAVWTGEKRPPRKGEWYLSGGIIEAYRAPNDFSTAYHIACLVKAITRLVTEIIE